MKLFRIILSLLFCCFLSLKAQDSISACQKNFDRIIQKFNKSKPLYLSSLKDSLKQAMIRDSIFSKYLKSSEEFDLNNCSIYIVPYLYINLYGDDYSINTNICDYLELDTLNYEYEAYIYYHNQLYMYCSYTGGCGIGPLGTRESGDYGFHVPTFYSMYFINDEYKHKYGKGTSIKYFSKRLDTTKYFPYMIRGFGDLDYANIEHGKLFIYYSNTEDVVIRSVFLGEATSYFYYRQGYITKDRLIDILKYCKPKKVK